MDWILWAAEGHSRTFMIGDLGVFAMSWAMVTGVAFAVRWAVLARRAPEASNRCPECGYDLTGNTSGRCPECGTPTTG